MAGAATTKWQRFKFKHLKFLYKKCPAGNFHKKSDKLCYCRMNEYDGNWHGGVLVFKTGEELVPYGEYYASALHEIWREIKPFLRYTGKSISDYASTEAALVDFMKFVSRNNGWKHGDDITIKDTCPNVVNSKLPGGGQY